MHISPLYTDAHWRKIHGMGLLTAMMFAALVSGVGLLVPGTVSEPDGVQRSVPYDRIGLLS